MDRARPYAVSKPLIIEEVDLAGPGPGCVLVEIVAAGLCHSDILHQFRSGLLEASDLQPFDQDGPPRCYSLI